MNEPYSGLDGLIFSARSHGRRHGVRYLELEINNRLLRSDAEARAVAARLVDAVASLVDCRSLDQRSAMSDTRYAMRIILIGQAAFAEKVLDGLRERGHDVAAVYCPPDAPGGKPDPLKARAARARRFRSTSTAR